MRFIILLILAAVILLTCGKLSAQQGKIGRNASLMVQLEKTDSLSTIRITNTSRCEATIEVARNGVLYMVRTAVPPGQHFIVQLWDFFSLGVRSHSRCEHGYSLEWITITSQLDILHVPVNKLIPRPVPVKQLRCDKTPDPVTSEPVGTKWLQ